MKSLKHLLCKAWHLFGDDRLWLLVAGAMIGFAFVDFCSGDYGGCAINAAIGAVSAVVSWHEIGKALA